ncbi:triphosphoribosyl-dephospho-CoA protein [Methanosalsum zhilinae DSM 4017]|uniref:Triphosphoribosyl-dephospho-CoA protein n=1 Tax=Methanosalsum zhilinae (strain DSM 4017 / NBRC 107636 / OCM 62 / WeN5) TaxID=679901 RepID=F7XQG8_METZD|nr:triphosphoribosyl-dephospho-CoA synthase [Methanosalsum zhilinae]AEH60469.1 triphosphoribosyl-dephospho-CoA protein [Methanosalsum zhilinae DSM 4017]
MKTEIIGDRLYLPENITPEKIYSYIAQCAQLAMLLEVSASPKPGNVDRNHNYEDTRYEHFLASAVSVHPLVETASKGKGSAGRYIRSAVYESSLWQRGGNTHFGAFVLLIPLSMAAGEIFESRHHFTINELISSAYSIVKNTDVNDAIDFYSAFRMGKVKVTSIDKYDLNDDRSIDALKKDRSTLFDLMIISRNRDIIADEWSNGFKRCGYCASLIMDALQRYPEVLNDDKIDINNVVVYAFLKILSENTDTFIQTKFDKETADAVSRTAKSIIEMIDSDGLTFGMVLPYIERFDNDLIDKKINPGSTADIVIAGLFIALIGGLRY